MTASEVALNAIQEGWSGPPFDPFSLAEHLRIQVVPNSDVTDARTVPIGGGRVRIEYNPARARARVRYSIAHEIAHTFFPDAASQVRNRAPRDQQGPDEWELEMLCNIGAAELLMPIGSLEGFQDRNLSAQNVLELRKRFQVSTESVLLRLIRVTNRPYFLLVASKDETSPGGYKVNYCLPSRTCEQTLSRLTPIPKLSVVNTCTAIGYTASADEQWPGVGAVHVECVGIASYSSSSFPRVAALVQKTQPAAPLSAGMKLVTGDATSPREGGAKIVAHVVNDATPNWGAGFGKVVQEKWPLVQRAFRDEWQHSSRKRLGDVFFSTAAPDLTVCQLVCQHGYGPSDRPRLRYAALSECLRSLRDKAVDAKASVHMPRIGTGEAGGSWTLVSALIDEVLCGSGVSVTIYDLPKREAKTHKQGCLFK